jgi:hypothetical protein
MRSISVASRADGVRSRFDLRPGAGARPFTSKRFFTANGTPASGPTLSPAAIAASTRAGFRTRAIGGDVGERVQHRIMSGNTRQCGFVASSADNLRAATACAVASAESPSVFVIMATSRGVDTGRLGFIRQRELIDQPRQPQRHFEVRPHGRPPGFLDRQRQRLGYRV